MNCRDVQHHIDNLLVAQSDEAIRPELIAHIERCPQCAREYEAAKRTLTLLQPSHEIQASSHLKERIMTEIIEMQPVRDEPTQKRYSRIGLWKPALAAGVVVLALAGASLFRSFGPDGGRQVARPAFSLLSQALAAEEALFAGQGIVHIVNEIIVMRVSDPDLAQVRWIPVVSLEATGKPRVHQLALPAKPDEGFVVDDQAWYDPPTGRFTHVLTVDGKAVFANSYDGEVVRSIGTSPEGGSPAIIENPVPAGFQPPESPARFLGIAAFLPGAIEKVDEQMKVDLGEAALEDGSPVQVVKIGFPAAPDDVQNSYWLVRIRKADNTIAEMEWVVGEESMLLIRRVKTETAERPGVPWNLAGVEVAPRDAGDAPAVAIRPDFVVPNVSVRRMIERADFETYVFQSNPPWVAGACQITDILDVASPPHRMFAVTYRADDGRHVVLLQSHSYNRMLGPMVKKGEVVYTSPNGFKVWSGPRDKWVAGILLQSARSTIKDRPSEDRTGYILESPAGTFPALAVNGPLTADELHALVDSLVPARELAGQ